MENMQKQLGNIFNNSFFTNAMENEDNTLETTSTVTQCKSCGANNTMSFGMSAECEYCGSSLS
jgi:Zn finger protein HypA/HybF involved in hydrogenase expression